MIEIEFVLTELEKLKAKEKSIQLRNHLEEAISHIRKYNTKKRGLD